MNLEEKLSKARSVFSSAIDSHRAGRTIDDYREIESDVYQNLPAVAYAMTVCEYSEDLAKKLEFPLPEGFNIYHKLSQKVFFDFLSGRFNERSLYSGSNKMRIYLLELDSLKEVCEMSLGFISTGIVQINPALKF